MLVHNWREVLKRAWSIRLMVLGLLFWRRRCGRREEIKSFTKTVEMKG
ncbi:hypothetical protein HF263_23810 [Rhizobium leguminosarum]|nr:hypothetical protein [Rhizobium leguminosarum]MBY2994159.1 hypothetical protein [Rhizobium leguminosarum]MBY3059077.1 hypothetical protein [Rhizobium leguminosarum]